MKQLNKIYRYRIKCKNCNTEWKEDVIYNRCPNCGGLLEISIDRKDKIIKLMPDKDISQIIKQLIVGNNMNLISLGEGNTPLLKAINLGNRFGIDELFLKNETVNPTGSFVDRGVSILAAKILQFGLKGVEVGFSPNFAISISAYLTRFNVNITAHIPNNTSLGKIYQLVAYGANITFGRPNRIYLRKENFFDQGNPYYREGLKTILYEVFNQLNGKLPDFIVVPMGTGTHINMIWEAIKDLNEYGVIGELNTKLIGVQSEECSELSEEMLEKRSFRSDILDDLCIEDRDLLLSAKEAIKESNGVLIKVTNKLISETAIELARNEGIFPEPAGAASIAGLKIAREEKVIDSNEIVVAIITGSGLKDFTYLRNILEANEALKLRVQNLIRMRKTSFGRTKEIILEILSEGERSIYQIWKEINTKYGLNLRYPTILQHIRELENQDLVAKKVEKMGRKRSIYSLTSKGKRILKVLL